MEKHHKTQFSTNQIMKTEIKGVSIMQNDPEQKKNSD